MTTASLLVGAAEPVRTRRASPRFYLGMGLAAVLVLVSGFGRSFFARPWTSLPPLKPFVVLHGAAFTGWITLFVAQAALATAGRFKLHRWLGIAGASLAALMIGSGVPIAFDAARRGALPGDPLAFLLVMLVDLLLFGTFLTAALLVRHRGESHERLMLLALISILAPAISRWPLAVRHAAVIPAVLLLFTAAAPVYDRLTGRHLHPVTLWGGLAATASVPIRFAVAATPAWHRLAAWLIR
jgi:hypothetical protein